MPAQDLAHHDHILPILRPASGFFRSDDVLQGSCMQLHAKGLVADRAGHEIAEPLGAGGPKGNVQPFNGGDQSKIVGTVGVGFSF